MIYLEVLEKAAGGEADYRRNVRAAIRALYGNMIPLYAFVQDLSGVVHRGLTRAFGEGLKAVGFSEGDLTSDEQFELQSALFRETNWVAQFGNDIITARDAGKPIKPLLTRSEMYVYRYESFKGWAMTMVGGDQKLRWKMNPIKEHCHTCLKLHGRVYRASVWRKADIYPRHRSLECGGWRCGCGFETTSDPVTRGRPPSIP